MGASGMVSRVTWFSLPARAAAADRPGLAGFSRRNTFPERAMAVNAAKTAKTAKAAKATTEDSDNDDDDDDDQTRPGRQVDIVNR